MKISPKTVSTSRKKLYFIFSTLNTVLFGQVTPKPNQKHHLDPIGLLMDGSGSGFLKSGSGSAKKPGSIRIRKLINTVPEHNIVVSQPVVPVSNMEIEDA